MYNTQKLGTESIMKLIITYSIPSAIGMLVNAIYNIVDRMFIGRFVGENALAGLTISFPIMQLFLALAVLIGIGGSSLIAIKFGEKNFDEANLIFGNLFSLIAITCIAAITVILLNLDSLLNLFGATSEVVGYAKEYMLIILFGLFFQLSAFTLNSIMRSEGHPNIAMLSMIVSAATNIVLDYVFIVISEMGVQGAAIATVIGQATGFIILVRYFFSGKSILTLQKKNLKLKLCYIKNICSIGSASFLMHLGSSLSLSLLNTLLVKYGGDAAIASRGAINSLFTMVVMPISGIQQGLQPIIGYNHGANLRKRVNKALFSGIGIASIFAVLGFTVLEIYPESFISLFINPDSPTMSIAINGLRLYIISLPYVSISFLGTAFFQATAQGGKAFSLGLAKQFVFLIPALIVLPKIFLLNGVWLAIPIADIFAVLSAVAMLFFFREPKKQPNLHANSEIRKLE